MVSLVEMIHSMKENHAERVRAWEELCDRCGLCCYERESVGFSKVRIKYDSPCRFLDRKTHQCTVYDHRFQACSTCGKVRMYHALFAPTMPPTCAYVLRYRPKWLMRSEADPRPAWLPESARRTEGLKKLPVVTDPPAAGTVAAHASATDGSPGSVRTAENGST